MGNTSSTSITSDFFISNFDENSSFVYKNKNGDKVLFSYREEDITDDFFIVNAEMLSRPNKSSKVTIRSAKNCDCKSDVSRFEPSGDFKVYFFQEGFHDLQFNITDIKFKYTITDIEREILGDN